MKKKESAPPRWENPPARDHPRPVSHTATDALELLCRIAARAHDPEAPQMDFDRKALRDLMYDWSPERIEAAISRARSAGLLDLRIGLPGDVILFSLAEEG